MGLEMRGKYWFSRFMIDGHKFARSTKTNDRKLAEQIEAVWKAEAVKSLMIAGEKPLTLFKAIELFLNERQGKGGHGSASVHLSHFKSIGDKPMKEIRLHEATEVIARRRLEHTAHNTLCVSIAYWNALQNWCKKSGYTPAVKMERMDPERTRIRYLTKEEERKLFEAINPNASYRGKNPINENQRKDNNDLLVVLLDTGTRLNEAQKLMWSQVDMTSGVIYVTRSKGGVNNPVVMTTRLRSVLERRKNSTPWVFPTKASGKVNTNWIRDAVKRAGINEDLGKVTLHTARHTVATRMLKSGMSIVEVQSQLGHKHLSSTTVYMHVVPSSVASKAASVLESFVE